MSYDSLAVLSLEGKSVTDFKTITFNEITYNNKVSKHSGTDTIPINPEIEFVLDYLIPKTNRIDWDTIAKTDRDLTFKYRNSGITKLYTGVRVLSVGQVQTNNTDVIIQPIKFMAKKVTEI